MFKPSRRSILPISVPVALATVCAVPVTARAAPISEAVANQNNTSASTFQFSSLPSKRFGYTVEKDRDKSRVVAINRAIRTYGAGPVRLYYPQMPAGWAKIDSMSHGLPLVVSFKALPSKILSGKFDARLRAWFREAPKSQTTWWSYEPEPEDDIMRGRYSAAQFRKAYAHVASLARKARNANLKSTLTLMAWTPNPKSHRNYRDYWPGSKNVDVIAFDFYNNYGLRTGEYIPPARNLKVCIRLAKLLNKDWGLGEFGSAKLPGDRSGVGRARWLRDMANYLDAQHAQFSIYFDWIGRKADYRLLDSRSRNAWRQVVTNQ